MPDDPKMDPEIERLYRTALRDKDAARELARRARARTGANQDPPITNTGELHAATVAAQGYQFGYHAPNDHPVVPVWRALDGREVRVNLVSPTPMDTTTLTNRPTYVGRVVKFLGMRPA